LSGQGGHRIVLILHQSSQNNTAISSLSLGCLRLGGMIALVKLQIGGNPVNASKIAVVALLCTVVALVACRREERLKLGGPEPMMEQPTK
jgi:hypothetical protein